MRVLIATDAWHPQVNGVVRTLDTVAQELRNTGATVTILSPQDRRAISLPSYPEIRLAWVTQREISRTVAELSPDHIHIATEGPIGFAARRWALNHGIPFTTGYHTRFAEYLQARIPLPGVGRAGYSVLRWFHRPSRAVMAPTKSIAQGLAEKGFLNVRTWTRGVDHERFRPMPGGELSDLDRPVMLYVGRVAVEKNLEAFIGLDLPGTKVIIGDGPARAGLEKKYPQAHFTGYRFGDALVRAMSSADVFVFPSRTDTFGLVMIEAMACGLPVAAFPVSGPVDVIEHGVSGWMDDDLGVAITHALRLERQDAVKHAARYSWGETASLFRSFLARIDHDTLPAAHSVSGRNASH